MSTPIDRSVYPDLDHDADFADDGDRADYVMRVCAGWDFGVPPDHATLELFAGWRDVFDQYPLQRSPAYHAFRALFRWPPMDIPESPLATRWERSDAREQREDPCRLMA